MLKKFFWMCSGTDSDLLSQCPKSEQIKYAGIGGTVFFTAVLAFIASCYALYTVFDNTFLAISFGLVWGLLIFNLDRFIVSSLKKRDDKSDEFLQAVPRLLLAVIIAVVISKPLELKVFEKEIDTVLLSQKNEMTLKNQAEVALLYDQEEASLQGEIESIKSDLWNKEQEVNALYDVFISEAEGTAGSGILGKGPVYKEKREKHDEARAELLAMKSNTSQKITELEQNISQIQENEQEHLASSQPIIDGFDGLMARVAALGELPWLPSFFIFLLFLAIETSPIFAKLLTPKGEYDIRLANGEEKVKVWAMQKRLQRGALLEADKELNKKVYTSIQNEEETYHYKKQSARALLRFQTEQFMDEQMDVAKG